MHRVILNTDPQTEITRESRPVTHRIIRSILSSNLAARLMMFAHGDNGDAERSFQSPTVLSYHLIKAALSLGSALYTDLLGLIEFSY